MFCFSVILTKENMTFEEELEELIKQGYSEEEALTIIKERKEEEEHLAFFRFQQLYNEHKN